MAREDRLGLVKRALGMLLDRLRPEDRVGLVVYGDRGEVRLRHTADHERLRRAIDELAPQGATNAEEGLRLGDDTVDAGEIGAGHEVTALYEVKLRPRPPRRGDVATLRLRYRPVGAGGPGEAVEIARALPLRDLERSFVAASPSLRLAAVAAEFAEVLEGSYWARGGSLAAVARQAAALSPR